MLVVSKIIFRLDNLLEEKLQDLEAVILSFIVNYNKKNIVYISKGKTIWGKVRRNRHKLLALLYSE